MNRGQSNEWTQRGQPAGLPTWAPHTRQPLVGERFPASPRPPKKEPLQVQSADSSGQRHDHQVELEALHLVKIYAEKRDSLVSLLSGQLAVLKTEAQVILGLCGLVITVTGFSGGNIIKAGSVSSGFMVAGIVFVLAAVSVAMCSLVRIRWVTQDLDDNLKQFATTVINRRNRQRLLLIFASVMLVAGLSCYMTAVAIAATVKGQVQDAYAPPSTVENQNPKR